jgi:hypothetical protein
MYRDGATVHHSPLSWERVLGTLEPRDLVTYCQAWGLSGHTSPCGECACFFCKHDLLHSARGVAPTFT